MFEKTLPFSNRVWYHITKPNIRSENMFDIIKEETDYDKYCFIYGVYGVICGSGGVTDG